jgi:hypothetical protein
VRRKLSGREAKAMFSTRSFDELISLNSLVRIVGTASKNDPNSAKSHPCSREDRRRAPRFGWESFINRRRNCPRR